MKATLDQVTFCVMTRVPDQHILEQMAVCSQDVVSPGAHFWTLYSMLHVCPSLNIYRSFLCHIFCGYRFFCFVHISVLFYYLYKNWRLCFGIIFKAGFQFIYDELSVR